MAALQLLYESTLGGEGGVKALEPLIGYIPDVADNLYIEKILGGVAAHQPAIDQTISRHLIGWTLERLAKVDLSILRLSVCELTQMQDIPVSVSIHEAMELSHIFSTDESGPFINGVLGNIARTEPLNR